MAVAQRELYNRTTGLTAAKRHWAGQPVAQPGSPGMQPPPTVTGVSDTGSSTIIALQAKLVKQQERVLKHFQLLEQIPVITDRDSKGKGKSRKGSGK